jgi:alkylation response protein AidB-like acyl-CoA dehydrogenase
MSTPLRKPALPSAAFAGANGQPWEEVLAFDADPRDPYLAKAAELRKIFHQDAAARDKAGGRPTEQIELIRKSGLLKVQIPREYGGEGQPISTAYRIVREFARTDGSLAHLFAYHIQQLNKVVTSGSREQQARLFTETAKNNLFWGNTGTSFQRTLTARRDGDDYVLNGYRTFSSGSHVADYISVVWDEDGRSDRISAFLPTTREGLAILDDWDGLGQRQTGSGTVTFTDVRVRKDEIRESQATAGTPFSTLIALLAQSALTSIFTGSAQGALIEARDYTVEHSRPFLASGVERVTDDPWIRRVYGELYAQTAAATLLADQSLRVLDSAWDRGLALTAEERGAAAISIAAANVFSGNVALDVTSRIFEVTGARSATASRGLDRFWRNVRTHTLHNPAEYKSRNVGLWHLTGAFPEANLYH